MLTDGLISLHMTGITHSPTHSGAYTMILREDEGPRRLPIVIGACEAQSIAVAMQKDNAPNRPLTHDLMHSVMNTYDIAISHVVIHKLLDGIFYSDIYTLRDGVEHIIDARTSDAVAMALRYSAPIYTYPDIMERAGVIFQTKEEIVANQSTRTSAEETNTKVGSKGLSQDEQRDYVRQLLDLLQQAVEKEDYESAARIRDEIKRFDNT